MSVTRRTCCLCNVAGSLGTVFTYTHMNNKHTSPLWEVMDRDTVCTHSSLCHKNVQINM